jgi:excisionase family DNA binding protein
MSPKQRTTTEAAKAVGITRATLQDWIKRGKFRAPRTQLRNGHAVRLWTDSNIARLRAVKKKIYNKVGRPKGSNKSQSKV